MHATVTFKDGTVCQMELIYNWDRCHMYRTAICYLIVPYTDVVHSTVSTEEYTRCQQAAKKAEPVKKQIVWSEVNPE